MMAQEDYRYLALMAPLRALPVLDSLPLDFLICEKKKVFISCQPYLYRLLLVGFCYLYLKAFLPPLGLQNPSELGVVFYSLVYSQGLA